ncbi:MAG: hypothetical protein COA69_04585 [Robiginitomaculum sp.]|nr:MAG: hypothetical protein COA69_04585 [Robiginitomaculum sp.]
MTKSTSRYFAGLFLLGALVLWGLSTSLNHGPKPKAADAPLDQFSAMRAFADLEDLVGNNKPHPSGSAENLRIRKLIEQKFTALGYSPEIQADLGCTLHYPGCTEVENIVVRLKGTSDTNDAIMLTAHYDGVPAGPGAADDGAGTVAILEVARILKIIPPLKNDIIFLFTDGEEGGLRGAQAFLDRGTMIKDVKLIINLESRGVSGPSNMFETSDGNLELIRGYARTNPHPAASSLSYEIYSRLPNDTDYSIYKPEGIPGLNYAFTGHVALYHSKHDTTENLDKASLQHHGDNMLAAVQAFGNADLEALKSTSNASYIDVFGKFLLYWPAALNLPLSLGALLVFVFAAFKTRPQLSKILGSFGAVIGVLVLTPALGWVLSFPLGRWPDLFYLDHPYPWPGRIALTLAAILVAWSVQKLLKRWLDFNALVLVSGFVFSLGGLALALSISGASYMFLLPAIGMAIAVLIDIGRKHERLSVSAHTGVVLMLYMAFYHFIAVEVIVHYKLSALRILPMVLLGIALLPVFAREDRATSKRFGLGLAIIMVVFTATSAFLPGLTPSHPRMQNLVYVQDHELGKAIWISESSGKQDKVFLEAAGFEDSFKPQNLLNILWANPTAKEAMPSKYSPPLFTLLEDSVSGDVRTISMDIQSSHGGYAIGLGFEKDAPPLTVSVNGQLASDYTQKPYRRPLAIRGGGFNMYHIVITTAADRPLNMAIIDTFSLTPEQLEGMGDLRPEISAPLHSGDRAHIFLPIVIECTGHCNTEK